MKILHISNARRLTHGQRMQLKAEYDAAKNLENVTWDILAFHTETPVYDFERKIPSFFSGLFLRKLYSWISILRVYKQYDIILERKLPLDLFNMFFGWFVPNRLTIHHAKEVAEMKILRKGWKGVLASKIEHLSGLINSKQILGYIGVTKEIASYENIINKTSLPELLYPNGIDTQKISLIEDEREEHLNIVFMSGSFNPWHGLDLLLNAIEKDKELIIKNKLTIHLIGKLNKEQLHEIDKINQNNNFIIVHGHLNLEQYQNILKKCDFGIGSLAMFRERLNEGATLKVREYLASGIPVYSGHKDTALPEDFPFYFYDPTVNITNMIEFGLKMRKTARDEVRLEAIPYIEKENIMKNLINKLKELGK
ncbi:Glycosyltransferase [hydrothermal vent metagenome]|uniref:Glycosyltransferase n=1 Tax=hydrothermal vent metagenome TaxID=652676 RepID=A0A1W1C355_9ZZZZ